MSVKKHSTDKPYGYKSREQKRNDQRKKILVKADLICQELWKRFLKNIEAEEFTVNEASIYQLYEDIYKEFVESESISASLMPIALCRKLCNTKCW